MHTAIPKVCRIEIRQRMARCDNLLGSHQGEIWRCCRQEEKRSWQNVSTGSTQAGRIQPLIECGSVRGSGKKSRRVGIANRTTLADFDWQKSKGALLLPSQQGIDSSNVVQKTAIFEGKVFCKWAIICFHRTRDWQSGLQMSLLGPNRQTLTLVVSQRMIWTCWSRKMAANTDRTRPQTYSLQAFLVSSVNSFAFYMCRLLRQTRFTGRRQHESRWRSRHTASQLHSRLYWSQEAAAHHTQIHVLYIAQDQAGFPENNGCLRRLLQQENRNQRIAWGTHGLYFHEKPLLTIP